ncbi:MAG: alkaline phosphatase family protein [Candidatus Marinimicrobia bacterium]|nr:alkaline phosphatase family protein [Candidatus Neomarinimicrobiota bacterium]
MIYKKNSIYSKIEKPLILSIALFIFVSINIFVINDFISLKKHYNVNTTHKNEITKHTNNRILIILIDSARKDYMFSDRMPFTFSLRDKCAWGISEVLSIPITVAGDHAIFSGIIDNPLAFLDYVQASSSNYDNIFRRLTKKGKSIAIFGKLIYSIYGEYSDKTAYKPKKFTFSQYLEEADDLFNQAYNFLSLNYWDFAIIQFTTLDYLGHLETPLSPNYPNVLKIIDEYIKQLISITTDQDIILITSEHGMDNNGFHMDHVPEIIDTPFILLGPQINKSGPNRILQIDWTPTISILAGVSPFYNSPALPALDMLELSDEIESSILQEFSSFFTGHPTVSDINKLREIRNEYISGNKSSLNLALVILAIIIAVVLLSYVSLCDYFNSRNLRFFIQIGFIGISILVLTAVVVSSNILEYISNILPFSANFILSHPLIVILFILIITTLIVIIVKYCIKNFYSLRLSIILILFIVFLSSCFLLNNPYNLFNWMLICLPIVGWTLTKNKSWIIVFCIVLVGLLIRRFTFYNAYYTFIIPDRWILCLITLILGNIFFFWRYYPEFKKLQSLWIGSIFFLPIIIILTMSSNVHFNGLIIILSIIPIIIINIKRHENDNILLSFWATFFYLGTSSTINHATHIIVFPLFLSVLSLVKDSSVIIKGIIITYVFWVLYLIPGNIFDLKILELKDIFIVDTAVGEKIIFTTLIIIGRYILPISILIWSITKTSLKSSLSSIISTLFLPIVIGIGITILLIQNNPDQGIYSQQFNKLIVLSGYFFILLSSSGIVALLTFSSKYFNRFLKISR